MRFAWGLALVFLVAGSLGAQEPHAVVKVRICSAAGAVHPGEAVEIRVIAQIEKGYHINDHHPSLNYLIPTSVTFDASPAWTVRKVIYPKGELRKLPFLDIPISVYEGTVGVEGKLAVRRGAQPGSYALRGVFAYQACNDYACLPPTGVPLKAGIRVTPSSHPGTP